MKSKVLTLFAVMFSLSLAFATINNNETTEVKEELFDCTVTLSCGGATISATASTCKKAGSIAGAGCDAAFE
ncbi:hypothetical protein GTQ40_04620 [Flavobacteriaceae bacterium R38]|nr:hypothetical protein [Flavobacteriaceae bacterium R38]